MKNKETNFLKKIFLKTLIFLFFLILTYLLVYKISRVLHGNESRDKYWKADQPDNPEWYR